jgi:hypothetical protein
MKGRSAAPAAKTVGHGRGVPRWPLVVIGAPAAVAVWSGWVGLGALCGFGVIHPLPGIWPSARLNTAITLPVGVEAYGAYALGAWLSPGSAPGARRFARRSAIGSLVLGMAGQVAYHLLAAAHSARAPWPVVVLVSCLPVATLGLATALTHLLREGAGLAAGPVQADDAEPVSLTSTVLSAGEPAALTAGPSAGPSAGSQSAAPEARTSRRTRRKRAGAGHRMPAADREAAVLMALAAEPALTHAELARRMGVDEATIRRVRKRLAPVTAHD